MDKLLTTLLLGMNNPGVTQTAASLLAGAGAILGEQLQADVVVAYELIPETGGVPRLPPACRGELQRSDEARQLLANTGRRGMLGDFIRHWQLHVEEDALSWRKLSSETAGRADYSRFIELEGIQSFIFLPIYQHEARLGAIFLNFRRPVALAAGEQQILDACGMLVGTHLARTMRLSNSPEELKKRVATAHTFYGGAALLFKGHLDSLQAEMGHTFAGEIPPNLVAQLETIRHTVFAVMRDLVIEASGDFLVDLRTMSLAKALNTTAAALRRVWPAGQRVMIDIPVISSAIERQPLKLRQLLYTLILELLGNALKHGGPAFYINVDLRLVGHEIYLRVIDHGKGFDRKTQAFSEYGLGFWQAFIEQHLGGTFQVASQPGFGTVVSARIPVMV